MNLPNVHPERRPGGHPHRGRLSRHARHLARAMLRARVAQRAGTLQVQVRQLDSAVSLREDPKRVHPDTDRFSAGIRVVVGPETRSLLRQLLESRDLRVQQQLVREIRNQVLRKVLAAVKRIRAAERSRAAAAAAGRRAAAAGRRAAGGLRGWFLGLSARARKAVASRARGTARAVPAPRSRTPMTAPERTRAARGRGFGTVPARAKRKTSPVRTRS